MNSGVYLLKSPYKGIEMLKIGCSKNVLSRVKTHKSSNPLAEFIGYIETDNYKWLEREIHHRCKIYKYEGEWFYNKIEILNYFYNHENFVNNL